MEVPELDSVAVGKRRWVSPTEGVASDGGGAGGGVGERDHPSADRFMANLLVLLSSSATSVTVWRKQSSLSNCYIPFDFYYQLTCVPLGARFVVPRVGKQIGLVIATDLPPATLVEPLAILVELGHLAGGVMVVPQGVDGVVWHGGGRVIAPLARVLACAHFAHCSAVKTLCSDVIPNN